MKQEWLLLDMHMHSEYSKINKPNDATRVKRMTAKEYVDILLAKKVKIFSITDHNYFSKEYYDSIDKYIKDNSINMKLINGVELDVYVILSDGTEDFIHVCIYFDDNTERQRLEQIINGLYRDDQGNLKKPYFNDILSPISELKTKFIVIPHGDKERGILRNHLIDNLSVINIPEYYKYAMYKIFNAFDVRLSFLDKSNEFWASSFCEKTKKFNKLIGDKTISEIEQIEKNITKKIKNKESKLSSDECEIYDYILKYGSYFAYFVFSDWHNAEKYEPQINNFIFGNIDYAFSAFEMATLDPISRIIKSNDYEIDIPPTILEELSFKINNEEKKVFFSPGLNAVVGKRGSGKSLLLSVIKNLVDKEDEEGAIKLYKTLNISEISAKNRGGIELSVGSLNSVVFLTQNEIKEIFDNPDNAQKTISSYFLDIKSLDISDINKIIKLCEKIKPYNTNYKNITSNILSIKKSNDFNYNVIDLINDVDVKSNFKNILDEFDELIKNIENINLEIGPLEKERENLVYLKSLYLKYISFYNSIIDNNNANILDINSKRTTNQITIRQNINDIQMAINNIKSNLEIQLNIEKLKILISNYSIENPPVEIYKKGKYLFITYYEIPENINEQIEEKILNTITRSSDISDIYKYVSGDSSKKLKSNYSSIGDELKKFINDDSFKAKKEFYEIKNINIDYKEKIKNMNDLKQYLENNDIVNLTNSSPGMKSVAYLDMLFDLEEKILILDQPEDNIDNDYTSNYLVPNIKDKKQIKQLIFVTHNPSVAVYGDAFNYIYVENNNEIKYTNYLIEKSDDKEKLINILEGGRNSFSNRNKKFGNVLGEEEYEIN